VQVGQGHRTEDAWQIGYVFELGEGGVLHPAFFAGDYSCFAIQIILLLVVGT
jgi:hypothetical protein